MRSPHVPVLTRRRAFAGVLLVGAVALATGGTYAVFRDARTVSANAFTSGTLALTTNPTTALVTYASMVPGDVVTNPLVVSNGGSEPLRYAVSSTATNGDGKGLKDALVLTVKTVDVDGVTCGSWDGQQLYTGDLDSSAGLIIGSAATGQDGVAATGGDRSLAGGAAETLCFRVSLPSSAASSLQNATTTATFTFSSEQTRNN
jgi:predicted ribosomally synthesized peptide with SipW-like signal peptide